VVGGPSCRRASSRSLKHLGPVGWARCAPRRHHQGAVETAPCGRRSGEQRLHEPAGPVAPLGVRPRSEAGLARPPVLKLVEEAVCGPGGLELEEAQHQRAGEARNRRLKGGAHAGQRCVQPLLQLGEEGGGIAGADREVRDRARNRAYRAEQPPEGAEQPEEEPSAVRYAGVVRFFEPGIDPVEQRAYARRQFSRRAAPPAIAPSAPAGAAAVSDSSCPPRRNWSIQAISRVEAEDME